MSHIFVILDYAGALFFWPLFWLVKRKPEELSQKLRRVFFITLLVLGVLAGVVQWVGDDELWRLFLFPLINLGSLMVSAQTCVRQSKAGDRVFQRPRVAAATGVVFVITTMMYMVGGFIKLDIAANKACATETVFGVGSHGVLKYRYAVNGKTYTGGGDPSSPPYPIGSTYEVRYSTAHPYFSTAQSPWTFFGQMVVACLFVGLGTYSVSRSALARRAATAS